MRRTAKSKHQPNFLMDSLLQQFNPEVNQQFLIFKTNISDGLKLDFITPLLDHHPLIVRWSIDITDIDNVLKVLPKEALAVQQVVDLMHSCGFFCEELED